MNRSEITTNLRAPWRGPDNGRIRAPAVLMVPGTHCGSHGCVEYSAELLRSTASRWNGTPVVINHPTDQTGEPISVQETPSAVVGHVTNARFEEGKLKAEIVVTDERVRDLVQGVSELSTGLYNEEQDGRATTIIPDHLALLPDQQGACSWEDGCGVRVNTSQEVSEAALAVLAERATEAAEGLNLLGGNAMQTNDLLLPAGVDAPTDQRPSTQQAEPDTLMPLAVQEAELAEQRQKPAQAPADTEAEPAPLLPVGVSGPSA